MNTFAPALYAFSLTSYNQPEMPILDSNAIEYISHTPEQTRRAGIRLGRLLSKGDVICLVGNLGAGKTTFMQGVSTGWGSYDHATSPTFVLVNVYRRSDGASLYHLDAYRLQNAQEAIDLDLEDMLEKGPLLVEWADRIREALPAECLTITFNIVDNNQRDLVIKSKGLYYERLQTNLRKAIFGDF